MRNYELMRTILVKMFIKGKNLEFLDVVPLSQSDNKKKSAELEDELTRLKEEGLIIHDMSWNNGTFTGGTVQKLTPAGVEFARLIKDNKVV